MRKVFWEDPYQRSLTIKVASVEGNRILLEETIAFSFSGSQESDKATLNGIPVLASEIEGNLIYYTMEEGHGLRSGDQVTMEIDWPRRYRLMRLHFAAELILASSHNHLSNLSLDKVMPLFNVLFAKG
jgi:Ser-tRNA(Ala) deacylase AlaX